MIKNFSKLFCALFLLNTLPVARATPPLPPMSINMSLQDGGAGHTLVSWYWLGSIVDPVNGATVRDTTGLAGFGGIFPGMMNTVDTNYAIITLVDFGQMTNLTTGASVPFTGLLFNFSEMPDTMVLLMGGYGASEEPGIVLSINSGDQVAYLPGINTMTIETAFSSFNAGSYSWFQNGGPGEGPFVEDLIVNLTIDSVPEPSALALAGVGMLGMLTLRHRRKL